MRANESAKKTSAQSTASPAPDCNRSTIITPDAPHADENVTEKSLQAPFFTSNPCRTDFGMGYLQQASNSIDASTNQMNSRFPVHEEGEFGIKKGQYAL